MIIMIIIIIIIIIIMIIMIIIIIIQIGLFSHVSLLLNPQKKLEPAYYCHRKDGISSFVRKAEYHYYTWIQKKQQ